MIEPPGRIFVQRTERTKATVGTRAEQSMKNWMILFALLGTSMVGVQAQEKSRMQDMDPQDRATMQTQKMEKDLGLSEEQVKQVASINSNFAEKAGVMRRAEQARREAARKEWKALMDARRTELKAVLNEEQFAKWSAHQEEMKQKRMKDHKEGHERMKEEH